MGLHKRRRRLDWPFTAVGYLALVLGLWFLGNGLGLLYDWMFPPPPDSLDGMEFLQTLRPLGVLLYVGLGVCGVGVWWWLSGDFIRRWWWKRTGQDGRVHDPDTP